VGVNAGPSRNGIEKPAGFWHTTGGVLTAIGGLIGSVAAVLTALVTLGVFSEDGQAQSNPPPQRTTAVRSTTTEMPMGTSAPVDATQVSDEEFRAAVYEGCVSDPLFGVGVAGCECLATEIAARITADDYWAGFAAMDRGEAASAEVQEAIYQAAAVCGVA
jgi:hypothetical protein